MEAKVTVSTNTDGFIETSLLRNILLTCIYTR